MLDTTQKLRHKMGGEGMKRFVRFCFLGFVLITTNAIASDPFLDFESEEYGVLVSRERNVRDYEGANLLKSRDPSTLRVLVTTGPLTPDADTYAVAEALFEGIKQTYTGAEFKVFGQGGKSNVTLASEVRASFDYVFIVGNNHFSEDYERDETIYGSRASGVRCSSSIFGDSVDCRETQSQTAPIGTRKRHGTRSMDIFFVNYGTGKQVNPSWSDSSLSNPKLAISSGIGHMSVSIVFHTSDESFCENTSEAQVTLARMTGANIVSGRPDKVSFTADPDDIGCNN